MGFWKRSDPFPIRSETFSLSYMPAPDFNENKHEPKLSEKPNIQTGEDTLVKTHGSVMNGKGDPNDPLCPILPSVGRNKDNNLAKFLENDTVQNKTTFRSDSRRVIGPWKESNKTKESLGYGVKE